MHLEGCNAVGPAAAAASLCCADGPMFGFITPIGLFVLPTFSDGASL